MRSKTSSRRVAGPFAATTLATLLVLLGLSGAAPAAGQLVYLANGTGPTDLYEVDLGTNAATYLLTFSLANKVHAITFCPDPLMGEVLIAVGRENGVVMEVDLVGLTETSLGTLPPEFHNNVVQLTCESDGTTIYLTDVEREQLFLLDLGTCPGCSPVLMGQVETAGGLADIDIDGADIQLDATSQLYLLTNGGGANLRLYSVDKASGLATDIGPVATGKNMGMTTVDWGLVISSNDDNIYDISTIDASVSNRGPVTINGQVLDIASGDMGSPPVFDCELEIDIAENQVRPGDPLDWQIVLRHNKRQEETRSFKLWIADADGVPLTKPLRSPLKTIRYMDVIELSGTVHIPAHVPPGLYRLYTGVEAMKQGTVWASRKFRVLE